MKLSRLSKLRVVKYSINVGSYLALSIAGIFTSLPEGTPLFALQETTRLVINTNIIVPVVFCLFGVLALLKDQIMGYFKFPKGIGIAVALFGLGFLGWLVSYWLMLVTGLYLILTILNTLYFNPMITEELRILGKLKKAEEKQTDE